MSGAVLVTGGAGFLGAYVARELAARGERVVIYDAAPLSADLAHVLREVRERVTVVSGQVLDLPTLLLTAHRQAVDRVVHAAALTDAQLYQHQPLHLFKTNLEGTLQILELVRVLGLGRLVYVSSAAVYPGKRYEPIDEEHPLLDSTGLVPSNLYGALKASAELLGMAYHAAHQIDVVAVRLSALYGFGMRQPVYIKPMVEGAIRNEVVRFASGAEMTRTYTYVKDAARAIVLALAAPQLTHRVFNAGGSDRIRIGELAELIRELVPEARLEVGPGLSDYERLDIERRGAITDARIRSELGFAVAYDLRRGLAEYIGEYRAYLEAAP